MDMEELKIKWNAGLVRIRKAEDLALLKPDEFQKFIWAFNKLCQEMSSLMDEYKKLAGEEIPEEIFENGFKLLDR